MSPPPHNEDRPAGPVVLVALDGTPAAATALPVASVVAGQLGTDLAILHVAERPMAEAEVRRSLKVAGTEWEPLAVRIEVGDPAEHVLRATEDPEVALVVLTTHGGDVTPGGRLGAVTQRVIAQVRKPVLLVRPEAAAEGRPVVEIRQVVIPLDGSPETFRALGPAIELADRLGAEVDLLYVVDGGHIPSDERGEMPPPRYVDQPQHEWPEWAREVVDHLCIGTGRDARCLRRPPRVFLTWGDVGEQIARFAAEHTVDAVVLVRRSRLEAGRARALRAVLHHGPCPALLVGGAVTAVASPATVERADVEV